MCRALLCLSFLNRLGGKVGEEGGEGAEEDAGEDIGRVRENAMSTAGMYASQPTFLWRSVKMSAAAKLDDVWPEGNE